MAPSTSSSQTFSPDFVMKNSEEVKCACGNNTFTEVLILRKVSAIVSPTAKTTLIPIEAMQCSICHRLLDPKQLS